MNKLKVLGLSVFAGSALMAFSAAAEQPVQKFSISPNVSTLGVGVEATYKQSDNLRFRGAINGLNLDGDRTISGIDYSVGANLASVGAIVDYHPFAGGLKLSGGVRLNNNEGTISATPSESLSIGGTTYTPEDIGTISGDVSYGRIAPYAGVGYSAKVTKGLSIGAELGAMFQGKPDVNLSANGLLGSNDAFRSDLERESNDIRSKLEDWTQIYPVASVSVTFNF